MMQSLINSTTKLEKQYGINIGYIYSLLSAGFNILSNFSVKVLHMTPSQLLYFRSILFIFLPYMIMSSTKSKFHSTSPTLNLMLIIRGFIGVLGSVFTFWGLKLIPLSEWGVIYQTTPVMTALLAPYILKEKNSLTTYVSLVFSVIGIILIAKPPILFGGDDDQGDTYSHILGVILTLTGAFFNSLVQILIKKLGAKTDNMVIVFQFGIIGTVWGSIEGLYEGFKAPSLFEWFNLVLLGVISFASQVLKNRSYLFGSAVKVSMMGYSQIAINFAIDVYIFDIIPSFYSIIGSFFIVSSIIALLIKD